MNGLFGSETLDIAIGLVLFFLLVSLLCSAAREAFEGVMRSRAQDLEKGLREMLADPKGDGLLKMVFEHPLLDSLFAGAYDPSKLHADRPRFSLGWFKEKLWPSHRNLPSYVPSANFATAILDIIARGPASSAEPAPAADLGGAAVTIEDLRRAAASFPDQRIGRIVLTAIDNAEGDLAKVKAGMETWFNNSMERVSGWYKRRTQFSLFIIGLSAAVILNLDALTVLEHLGQDKALRQNAVAAATKRIEAAKPGEESKLTTESLRHDLDGVGYPTGWRDGRPLAQAPLCLVQEESPLVYVCDGEKVIHPLHSWGAASLEAKPVPVVNPGVARPDAHAAPPPPVQRRAYVLRWGTALVMLAGWLVTALACMLGAPFWFDMLSKVISIRSTMKPEAPASPAAPDPATKSAPAAATANGQPAVPGAPAAPATGASGDDDADDPAFTPHTWTDRADTYEGAL